MTTKKIILGILVIALLTGGILAYKANTKKRNIVILGNQKQAINNELAVKTIDNVKDFQGDQWLSNGKILGIKNQVIQTKDEKNQTVPIICLYNPKDKSFEELTTLTKGERVGLGYISKDETSVFYSVHLNNDFKKREYDTYLLNLKTKQVKKVLSKETGSSGMVAGKQWLAAGMKVYQCDLQGDLTELQLPQELVHQLSDFESFTLKDYLKAYFNDEKVEPYLLKMRESNYKADKENNAIIIMAQVGDELYLQSRNSSQFIYNLKKGTYRKESDEDYKKFFPERYGDKTNNLDTQTTKVKRECANEGTEVLWRIDDAGNKVKLIAKGNFITDDIQVSPNQASLVYYLLGQSRDRRVYIYDFEKDKKISIFPQAQGRPIWNASSKQFFMSSKEVDEDKRQFFVTSIVKLRD